MRIFHLPQLTSTAAFYAFLALGLSAACTAQPDEDAVGADGQGSLFAVEDPALTTAKLGRSIVKLLKDTGTIPNASRVIVSGDRNGNDSVSARITYEQATQTHVIHVTDKTFDALGAGTLSQAAVALMICHELGHHFANGTVRTQTGSGWSEGEADYFASSKCIVPVLAANLVPIEVPAQGDPRALQQGISMRQMGSFSSAGQSAMFAAANLLQAAATDVANFRSQDTTESTAPLTRGQYPSAQCRLDTYFAGVAASVRPACWAPRKCTSIEPAVPATFSYVLSGENHIIVLGDRKRVVADLQAAARPTGGSPAILGGQPVRVFFDARSGTGNGLFVYKNAAGQALLAHDGQNRAVPLTCVAL
jgi:hypothetical protein